MYHKLNHETIDKLLSLGNQSIQLYLALCKYASINDGVCWPGYARLRTDTRISSGTEMLDAINALCDAGLLETWLTKNKRYYKILGVG